jgi:hypothetical protein
MDEQITEWPMQHGTVSAETLMRQAGYTADEYLKAGIEDIDKRLGKGFAKAHPELLAAYMHTAAADFASTFVTDQVTAALRDAAETIAEALTRPKDGD